MRELFEGLPGDLPARLAGARERLLALDYDGTLAPLRVQRELAHPLPGMLEALRAIAALPNTRVAVISGRPVAELASLLAEEGPLPPLELLGEHGWERVVGDELHLQPLPAEAAEALANCIRAAEEHGCGPVLERKRTGVVLHTRGLSAHRAEPLERVCLQLWREHGLGHGLRVDQIDGGIEARVASRNKGTAVRELAEEAGTETLVVYVGDDRTDEDAFRALGERGIGLRVARRDQPTAASGTFASSDELLRWLEAWPAMLARPAKAGGSAR